MRYTAPLSKHKCVAANSCLYSQFDHERRHTRCLIALGSFVAQYSGTMDRGAPQLLVTVVPDSGTDELLGISGQLTIRTAQGNHFYTLAALFQPSV